MAIKVKCPNCRERLFAEESDRGGSLRCHGCDTRVPVPAAEGAAPPLPTLARAVVPTLAKVAVPMLPVLRPKKPVADDIVDAEVIAAVPVLKPKSSAAIPTVAPLAEPETRKPKSKTGFRLRGQEDDDRPRRQSDDDDDDDDADDDRQPAAKGGSGLLFVILGVGVLLLGGIGVGVYFLTREDAPAAVADNPDPKGVIPGPGPVKPNPNPNPIPGGVKPGNLPDKWNAVTADGFTFHAPDTNLSEEALDVKGMSGRVWASKELGGGVGCAGAYLDRLPGAKVPPLLDCARDAFQLVGGKLEGNRAINGRSFGEFQFDAGAQPARVWAHVTEDRLFLFRFNGNTQNPAVADKRTHFQANLKVTHPVGNVVVDPVDPIGPKPPPKPVETPFQAVPTLAEDGFAVDMPGGAKVKGERHVARVEGKYNLGGKKFEVKDGLYTFQLYYHDLADEAEYDADKCYRALMPHAHTPAGTDDKVGGHPATRWAVKNSFGGQCPGLTVRVGFRVYSLLVTKDGIHREADADLDARGKKFLDSLKVTFDAKKAPTEASDPTWVAMARTEGFTATAPRGTEQRDYRRGFQQTEVIGKQYTAEDDQVKCVATLVVFGPKADADSVLLDIHGRDKILDNPKDITQNGMAGKEFTQGTFFNDGKVWVRTFVSGNAAAVLKVEPKGGQPAREVMLKARAFLNSFKMGGGGGVAGPGPVTVGNGEFASAGKVSPFWTAVVLPGKKELLTLGARNAADANPGGVLRRYSYPDFKLKATYHLPLPVNRAVADEKTGKLICSVISKWPTGAQALDPREAASWTSDLQLFDLRKITDGSLVEAEEVKPLGNRIAIGQPISGLEVEPAGGFAYAAAVVLPAVKGQPPRPATGRLYKIDTDKGEVSGTPISHPEPLDGLRIAPFGRTLVTAETLVGPPRPGKQYNLLTVDAVTWKKAKLIPIPAPAKDLTFTAEGILALAAVDAKTLVFGYSDGAPETADVTPKDIPLDGFSYLRVTPDGKRAVAVAGMKQNGLLLMTVAGVGDKAKFVKVTSGSTVAGAAVGGHFILTPDSKYAVFNCGAVVDLEKTTAPPKGKD